jgi:hypothetical protein
MEPTEGERPIGHGQPGIVAGHERAGHYQQEGRARDQNRKAMKTLVHKSVFGFQFPVFSFQKKQLVLTEN